MPDARRPFTDGSAYRAKDEFYAYDNLNRLATWKRGDLNAGKTDINSPVESQTWDFDALGNWQSTVIDTVTQNRTHNAQNQIKTVNTANLVWSGNGELTTDESGTTLTYDAWGRVVEIDPAGAAPAVAHAYDAANRRISEGSGELFYSADWQVLEERDGSNDVTAKHYWASSVYVDALIARSDPGNEAPLFVHQDRMFNVTALSDFEATVLDRFQYRAYGERTVLDEDWDVDSDGISDYHLRVGFFGSSYISQSMNADAEGFIWTSLGVQSQPIKADAAVEIGVSFGEGWLPDELTILCALFWQRLALDPLRYRFRHLYADPTDAFDEPYAAECFRRAALVARFQGNADAEDNLMSGYLNRTQRRMFWDPTIGQ